MSDDESSDNGSRAEILEENSLQEPTEEEVLEYAEFLGIDPENEAHLMWIAKEGVAAPVPHPWKACKEGEDVFYFNLETKESIWDHPCDDEFRARLEEERAKGPPDLRGPGDEPGGDHEGPPVAAGAEDSARASDNSFDSSDGSPGKLAGAAVEAPVPAAAEAPPAGKASAVHAAAPPSPGSASFVSEAAASSAASSAREGGGGGGGTAEASATAENGPAQGAAPTSPGSASFVSEAAASSAASSAQEGGGGGGGTAEAAAPAAAENVPAQGAAPTSPGSASQVSEAAASSAASSARERRGGGARASSGSGSEAAASSAASSPRAGGQDAGSPQSSPQSSPQNADAKMWERMAGGGRQSSRASSSVASRSASPAASPRPGAASRASSSGASPAASPRPASKEGIVAAAAQGSRPPPKLDVCAVSAPSSNPSEVSEDFRSDWGALSPPLSPGGNKKDGESLELSATDASGWLDASGPSKMTLSGMPAAGAAARACPSVPESEKERCESQDDVDTSMGKEGVLLPKTWEELQLDLEALAGLLQGVRDFRAKQEEYVKLLKSIAAA